MLLNFRNTEPVENSREWRSETGTWKFENASSRGGLRLKFRDVLKAKPRRGIVHPARSTIKRALDMALAISLLIALTPTLCALAFIIRRDGGPALFRHRRIGADGRAFYCLKFRSMCMNAEEMLKQHLAQNPEAQEEWDKDFKLKNDPRVTRLGALMRRTSLDELPQLLNVLKGDMSLVGPRPIVTAEITRYGGAFASYLRCRPGITGLWQVSGRNDIDYGTRIELDSRYAANWSFLTDLSILFRTFSVVLRRSGAY